MGSSSTPKTRLLPKTGKSREFQTADNARSMNRRNEVDLSSSRYRCRRFCDTCFSAVDTLPGDCVDDANAGEGKPKGVC